MQRVGINQKKNKKVRISNNYNKLLIKKNTILTIFQLIFLIGIAIFLLAIIRWNILNFHTKKETENVKEAIVYEKNVYGIINENIYSIDFDKLKNINPDTIGWLKVNGTKIEYPVVQANDNDYYLYHSFDKNRNNAGWIFMDYRNNAEVSNKNIIIYGHNRKDGSIFGSLKNVLKSTWYENEDNLDIEFWINNEKNIYKVFSIYETEVEDYYISTAMDNYLEFFNNIKNRSIKSFDVNLSEESQILTLSTCSNTSEKRVVLHAVKIDK